MSDLESYRKQAKLLVRWRREGNWSLGGRVRQLARFGHLTDRDVLAIDFPLALAQEIVAFEAGHRSWAALKRAVEQAPPKAARDPEPTLRLKTAVPVLFVRDVTASAHFYRDRLGFQIDFLHGNPPFYGAASRDGAVLHLKFVHEPVFGPGRVADEGLIMAFVPIDNLRALHAEYQAKGVPIVQAPTRQAWDGTDFHVEDPDGNRISFVSMGAARREGATAGAASRKAAAFKAAAAWDLPALEAAVRAEPGLVRQVDKAGYTLLHRTALANAGKLGRPPENALALADFLLGQGADLEAVKTISDDGELFPATPVWCAASWGANLPLVTDLIRRGAKTDNCLFAAVYGKDIGILAQVLTAKPFLDPVAQDETPFFYAVRLKRLEAARMLAEAGADVSKPNGSGETPLQMARRRGYARHIIGWLEDLSP
jgi:catechol 2,3-dioxygenase-like lactoylglutathione lyase family enzyme